MATKAVSKPSAFKNLRIVSFVLAVLLMVDFLAGMFVTIWVELPEGHPGTEGTNWLLRIDQAARWAHTGGGLALGLHSILGTALVVASLWLVWLAIKAKDSKWIAVAVLGFIGLVVAATAGSIFVAMGSDTYSYVMSIGFFGALIAYLSGLMIKSS
jgi:hypothetical protein